MVCKKNGSRRWVWAVLGVSVVLGGCGGGGGSGASGSGGIGDSGGGASSGGTGDSDDSDLSLAALAGKALFNDKSLSVSGKQSCATCHVAALAFTADPATDAAEVVGRLQQSPASLQAFIAAYGSKALSDPNVALADMGLAIAAFETEDADFHPFSSKFDYWQAGKVDLTPLELQGLASFNNPGKGNCTACHPSQRQGYDEHALFTDFTYDNIGVPRNWDIPANAANPVSPISGRFPAEIDAVVAFLCTLTDGYDPANPSAYNVPAQCRPTASGT
jgi:cytochrome c peroxidase